MFSFGRFIGISRGLRKGRSDGILSYISRTNLSTRRGDYLSRGARNVAEDFAIDQALDTSDELWELFYTDIINATSSLASQIRTGQQVVIDDYAIPAALDYCADCDDEFDPDEFISHIQNEIGDEKWDAVDEIYPDVALDLYEANQAIYGIGSYGASFALGAAAGRATRISGRNTGSYRITRTIAIRRYKDYLKGSARLGNSLFSKAPTLNRVYSSNRAALVAYQNQAIVNFRKNQPKLAAQGYAWNSYKASSARSRATARKFLKQYPNGRPRNDVSWALTQNAFENRYRP